MLRYRLTFLLPTVLCRSVRRGRQPTANGVTILVGTGHLIEVEARSQNALINETSKFLRTAARGIRCTIPAGLYTIDETAGTDTRDDFWISIGSDVVFARDVFARSAPPPPAA